MTGEQRRALLESAISAHTPVHIVYTDREGRETTRLIAPFMVVDAKWGEAYVHAYCFERDARRSFRLDRIEILGVRDPTASWGKLLAKANADVQIVGAA